MKPTESEKICLVCYELARIRLGGGPESRPSFWSVYREEVEFNAATQFRNDRVRICRDLLAPVFSRQHENWFFRKGRLVEEKLAQ